MLVNMLAQYRKMEPMKRLDLLELDGPLTRAEALITLLRSQGTVAREQMGGDTAMTKGVHSP
jgi:hypothetical protein